MTTRKAGKNPRKSKAAPSSEQAVRSRTSSPSASGGPTLLAGGNPQIPMGYGDEHVQKYIAAMPGWKSLVGKRLDALIVKAFPKVEKAVKWNSPLYGKEKGEWFLGFHCLTSYVKVAFFRGADLDPVPPGGSRQKDVRYLDIHEDDGIDEKTFLDWVKQAAKLPGERM